MSGPQPGGSGRVGIVENWEMRQRKSRDANSGAFKGMLFVVVTLLLITVGGWTAARPQVGPFLTATFEEHPGIINYPIIGDVVAAEFADRLDKPAGTSDEEIVFVVANQKYLRFCHLLALPIEPIRFRMAYNGDAATPISRLLSLM